MDWPGNEQGGRLPGLLRRRRWGDGARVALFARGIDNSTSKPHHNTDAKLLTAHPGASSGDDALQRPARQPRRRLQLIERAPLRPHRADQVIERVGAAADLGNRRPQVRYARRTHLGLLAARTL